HVNVIWQGDANAQALRCLAATTTPTSPINVSGPEVASVRWLAEELGRRSGKAPTLTGQGAPTAWLINCPQVRPLLRYPRIPPPPLVDWVADWVGRGQRLYGKPTKFEYRDGRY